MIVITIGVMQRFGFIIVSIIVRVIVSDYSQLNLSF